MRLGRAPLFPQEVADQLMHTMAAKGGSGEQKGLTWGARASLWFTVERSREGKPQYV